MVHGSSELGSLDIATLRQLYQSRKLTPRDLIIQIYRRIRAAHHPNVWVTLLDEAEVLARAGQIEDLAHARGLAALPLFGIPFAVKDNIDIAGVPTTVACRDFAYLPTVSSPVVEKLLAAGAILIGTTNLDQFATGLTGLLSSYGGTRNPFNPAYISGGSSSGSAVAVAAGFVSFALGTDTAGSGRIPAAFNNLVGLKPTRGLLSTRGLFPACRSLDCLSFLTLNVNDAQELLGITKGFDPIDPYSRRQANSLDLSVLEFPTATFRFGVPPREQLEFYGDAASERLYYAALDRLESLGGRRMELDAAPFFEAGDLLYQGPWIAERLAAVDAFHAEHAEAFHPITHQVMARGRAYSAMEAYRAMQQLQEFRRKADERWALMDFLVLPTAGTILRISEAENDPVLASAKLGRYTNFVNLLDLAALALPAGLRPDGLPFGITLISQAFTESNLMALGQRFAPQRYGGMLGATAQPEAPLPDAALVPSETPSLNTRSLICVVGAHLSGQPLNYQLTELDGTLVRRCKTAPQYHLYALPDAVPPKPGLARSENGTGVAIEVEVWSVPTSAVGSFLARVLSPLCIGNIILENGENVKGFLCEPYVLGKARDISHHGGWIHFLAHPI